MADSLSEESFLSYTGYQYRYGTQNGDRKKNSCQTDLVHYLNTRRTLGQNLISTCGQAELVTQEFFKSTLCSGKRISIFGLETIKKANLPTMFRIRIRIRIHRIHVFLRLPDLDQDPLVRGMDPDPTLGPDPDPSIMKQI
jgi:hypothetical protein